MSPHTAHHTFSPLYDYGHHFHKAAILVLFSQLFYCFILSILILNPFNYYMITSLINIEVESESQK